MRKRNETPVPDVTWLVSVSPVTTDPVDVPSVENRDVFIKSPCDYLPGKSAKEVFERTCMLFVLYMSASA